MRISVERLAVDVAFSGVPQASAGSAGIAGIAGIAGSAGSAGSAGRAGSAGSAGSAGTGGTRCVRPAHVLRGRGRQALGRRAARCDAPGPRGCTQRAQRAKRTGCHRAQGTAGRHGVRQAPGLRGRRRRRGGGPEQGLRRAPRREEGGRGARGVPRCEARRVERGAEQGRGARRAHEAALLGASRGRSGLPEAGQRPRRRGAGVRASIHGPAGDRGAAHREAAAPLPQGRAAHRTCTFVQS